MTQMQKFLFDTAFDGEPPGDVAPAKKPPKYTDEDLSEAENKGIAAGRLAGLEQAKQGSDQQAADALAVLTGQLADLGRQWADAVARHESETLRFIIMALRKLLPELTRRHALTEVESLVTQCFETLREEPRVVIRTADGLHDALRARVETLAGAAGFEGRVVLLTEETLQLGDVRIEWADGGIERDTARIRSEIEAILNRALERPEFACPDLPEAAAAEAGGNPVGSATEPADPAAASSETAAPTAAAQEAQEPNETGVVS